MRVRNQIALLDQRDQIIELEKYNSILAMIVTANHELNQPLTTIQGYLHLLKDELNDKGIAFNQKYLQKIESSVDQMASTLEKYSSTKEFEITSYLKTGNSNIKMVKFSEKHR
jgi:signal transduction histidine kinase